MGRWAGAVVTQRASRHLVVGGGGLLGGAVRAELISRGADVTVPQVPWTDEERAVEILDACVTDLSRQHRVAVWWCAGAGVTASSAEALAAEQRVLDAFVGRLATLAGAVVSFFYASSAGGVYAGSAEPPFTEATVPVPLSAYGEAKLRAEASVARLGEHGIKVAIARIANLYGPGQNLAKAQGLISQLCLAWQNGRPINIYVSLDTMRDYLYCDDAAALCADFVAAVGEGATPVVTKIIASGRSVTIGALLGEAIRVFRRRVPVVLAASPLRRQQARDLRLRSVVLPDLDRRELRTLGWGMSAVRRSIEAEALAGAQPGGAQQR